MILRALAAMIMAVTLLNGLPAGRLRRTQAPLASGGRNGPRWSTGAAEGMAVPAAEGGRRPCPDLARAGAEAGGPHRA